MKYRIAGIGELLWDLLPGSRQLGGAPANFAYHVQALGGEGIVVSGVGDDELGKEILNRFDAMSLATQYIAVDRQHPTGTVSVRIDAAGKPTYNIHPDVAWDFIPPTGQLTELAGKVDAVCFGALGQRAPVSRQTIRWFLQQAFSGALCIFDVTLRPPHYSAEILESSLQLCHVLKLNEDELKKLAEVLALEGDEQSIIRKIAERYNLRLVAYTRGEKGSLLYSRGEVSEHPGYRVPVADTVGAGDAFAAALVLGMLLGKKLDVINKAANRLAAFVCSRAGATPRIPEELRRIY